MKLIQITKKLFILTLLSLISISCGMQQKTVEYDDFSGDVNQPIIFSEGWGTNYNYPVIVDISTAITSENSNLYNYIQLAVDTWNNAIGRTILQLRQGTVTKTGNSFSSLFFYDWMYFEVVKTLFVISENESYGISYEFVIIPVVKQLSEGARTFLKYLFHAFPWT